MKTSTVTFAELRRLLLDLGFTESRPADRWRFIHASGAAFLFRPYAANDYVALPDLASVRTHLEWRGLLSTDAFDDSFAKTPA